MEQLNGIYVMRVASMLTGMHPQTLRKYERAGLLKPFRSKKLRMYSEEDIARLKLIKYLVDEVGLNLAGVKMALQFQDKASKMRKALSGGPKGKQQLGEYVNEILKMLGKNGSKD